jgi:mycothiol system anti-sigma-R factor
VKSLEASQSTASVAAYSCEDALPRLFEFVDNELSLGDLKAVQDHLEGCESCAYEHEVRFKLKSVIHEKCFEPAPQELKKRVAANIARLRTELAGQAGLVEGA